ncbi:MAG: hypothetical protein AAF265_16770 [Pseudomonadota bacterium]
MKNLSFAFAIALCALSLSTDAIAQTLASERECNHMGGSWAFTQTPPLYGICTLDQYYEANWTNPLEIQPGVRLEIVANGHLHISSQSTVLDTAELVVNGGRLTNDSTLHLTNKAILEFDGGVFNNNALLDVEGDVLVNDTPRDPNTNLPDCIRNNGTLRFYDGGNLLLQGGCIDGKASGVLRVEADGTMISYAQSLYRGGATDTIWGRFIQHSGAFNEFSNLTMYGDATIEGYTRADRNNYSTEQTGYFTIAEGGNVTVFGNGLLEVYVSTFDIAGSLRLEDFARLRDDNGLTLTVMASGLIQLQGGASAWYFSNFVDVLNDGRIEKTCLSKWYPTRTFLGNKIFTQYCRPVPISPPRLPTPIPLL